MKFSKIMSLLLCAGIFSWNALAIEVEKDDDGNEGQIKTMDQAWKVATEQFGEDLESAKRAIDFYKANFAEKIKYLEKELKDDPEKVVSELSGDLGRCNGFLGLKDENPEEYSKQLDYMKLEIKTNLLGEKIQDLKDEDPAKNKGEIEKLSKELKTEIGKLFDLKLQMEKEGLKNLEKEIDNLRVHIKKREEKREKIIDRKFNQLIGAEEDLEF